MSIFHRRGARKGGRGGLKMSTIIIIKKRKLFVAKIVDK